MVGRGRRASATKNYTRTNRPELTIKTTFLDVATSEAKSQAAASSDWRRRAAAVSSPGGATKGTPLTKSKHGLSGSSDSLYSTFTTELGNSSSNSIQYRRPRKKQAPWEMVLSAPAWQEPSSLSSSSKRNPQETIMVQLKHVNPMVMNINGEDVTLPNRFFLEVIPVESDTASSSIPLGALQRLRVPTSLRRMSSEVSEDLLVELKEILSLERNNSSSDASPFSAREFVSQYDRHGGLKDSSETALSDVSVREREDHYERAESPSVEEARFQKMLSRLQKKTDSPLPTSNNSAAPKPSGLLADPAIVAIKIKEDVGAPERSSDAEQEMGPVNKCLSEKPSGVRNAVHQGSGSGDSGYHSNDSEHVSTDPPAQVDSAADSFLKLTEPSQEGSPIKGLNPAATEFRSSQTDSIPCFVPKKISRPPLTNIFPGAMPNHVQLPSTTVPENLAPEARQQTNYTTGSVPQALLHILPTATQPPAMGVSRNGIVPGVFSSVHVLPQQLASQVPFSTTLPVAGQSTTPLATSFGTYPSAATPNSHVGIPTLSVPAINAFNTLPCAPGIAVPAHHQSAAPTLSPCLPATAPYGLAFQQSSLGPDTKSTRPYFPVTTKPRDHDPVKQQMYEAYLEWRKANEPGYHMKCKMRQAQRVVRQYQEKQDQSINASWKAIAEKAKAAVGAVAAAAAAEQKSQQESVKNELRAKVQKLSQVSV